MLSLLSLLHHFHSTYTNHHVLLVVQVDLILNFHLWVHCNPIPKLWHTPPTPEVLRVKEGDPTLLFFYCFTLGPTFGSFEEFGGMLVNFKECVMCLHEKETKLLRNVKIKWISILFLVKRVMEWYQPMITNMHDDDLKNSIVNETLNFLCDLELILSLHAILPLLDYVHTLIKFAQSHNMFICNVIQWKSTN